MGLKFDRVLEHFDGPLEKIADVDQAGARQGDRARRARWASRRHTEINDAFIAVNRLLKAGEEVFFVGDRSFQSAGRHRRDLHHREAVDGGGAAEGRDRSRPRLHRA